MPSNMTPIQDAAITRGMNTVDDPKTLKPGECVRLLNAFPGNPPRPRTGCTGLLMTSTTTFSLVPPGIAFNTNGAIYIIAWVYDSATTKYKPLSILSSDGSFTDLGSAGGAEMSSNSPVFFDLLDIHSCIYGCISQVLAGWRAAANALGHKVFESNLIVRDLCISVAGSIKTSGGLTKADSGGSIKKGWYNYAFQYVRHTSATYFEAGTMPAGMIAPYNITSSERPKRMDTFLPGACIGIEDIDNRKSIEATDAANDTTVTIDITVTGSHAKAMAQGATHLRVSRSLVQTTQLLAEDATKFFLVDLPLLGSGGTQTFTDTVSSAALEGEANQLVTGYSEAPPAAFMEYLKGRLYLMALDGRVYFSESVGGDGGVDLATAQAYPQAWSSLFKPTTYYLDCDYVDGQQATGMKRLGDDLFMFKERKIFAIFGGDPTSTPISQVSNTVGCAFPYTLTKAEIKGMFGKCILFLGNDGPMVLEEGGRVRPFSEFKIKELWPEYSQELYSELDLDWGWISHNCTAAFFKNTWWVMYQTKTGTSKIFGYYFDPDLGTGREAPNGPLEFQFAEM